ncbi:uncharacterized protein [Coffea arabica]|uniref:Uncharacterized protein n=1 Tax=Coffea arabica TaxID=13443 RepID=A0ABM4VM21_COFAR
MAVTLYSGKVLNDPIIESKTKSSEKQDRSGIAIESPGTGDSKNGSGEKTEGEDNQHMKVLEVKAYVPPIPFPQRLKKKAIDEQYQKFVEMLKKLQVNMPFFEVLANILAYAKFLKKLKFANLILTQVILQLVDCSVRYPMGIVEDLLVNVDKFYFPVDFIILDMEKDISILIILSRGFLVTKGANIDLLEGKLTLRVGKEKEEFNIFEPLKYPSYKESCSYIATTDDLYGEKYVLEQHMGFLPLHDHCSYSFLAVRKRNVDVNSYAVLRAHKLEEVQMSESFHLP